MIEPVVKQLWVPASGEAAFQRFTSELDAWWPRQTHSVSQERCASVSISPEVGGRLFEIDTDGEEHLWGTVEAWDPPNRFQVTWHPSRTAEHAQRVEVTFTAADGGTSVRLTHSGWEVLGDLADEVRARYDGGWGVVLDLLGASLGSSSIHPHDVRSSP